VYCRLRPVAPSRASCLSDGVSLALAAEDGKQHSFSFDKVPPLPFFSASLLLMLRHPGAYPKLISWSPEMLHPGI